jgi:hypothetical protein
MSNILTFVLRNSLGDSTNNGLSEREDSIILHHGDGVDLADLTLIPDDELVLVEMQFLLDYTRTINTRCLAAILFTLQTQDFHLLHRLQFMTE